jgi:hypothetical protein
MLNSNNKPFVDFPKPITLLFLCFLFWVAHSLSSLALPSRDWLDKRVYAAIGVSLAACRVNDQKEDVAEVGLDMLRSLEKRGLSLSDAQLPEVQELSAYLYKRMNRGVCDWDKGQLEAAIGEWLKANGYIE